jgi:beta-N-acetylhexosaminidase
VNELDRLAAACLLPSFEGTKAPDWMRRLVADGLGGVVLFATNTCGARGVAPLTGALRAERAELVVAVDEEGGDVTRLEASCGSSYPGNLALGAVDDAELTREVAGAIAADLARAGVTMNLAPVADVNMDPRNPVIGVRSFGSDPALVARHVAAFVDGTQRQGVAACAKHFPGHGDTDVDSHLALPRINRSLDELRATELVPFATAVEAGVRAVMTAHIVVCGVDDAPATLSSALVTELLRGELGFSGVVVTDALDMHACARTVGVAEAAVRALEAGADALCLGPAVGCDGVAAIHGEIVSAARSGRLSIERLEEAATRVRELGAWAAPAIADGSDRRAVGAVAASRAVHAEGQVRLRAAPVVLDLAPEPLIACGPQPYGLGDAIRRTWPDAVVVRVEEGDRVAEVPDGAAVVVALRDGGRHAWQQAVASRVLAAHPDAIVVETGVPGWRAEDATRTITTYGAARVNLEAAAALLDGARVP